MQPLELLAVSYAIDRANNIYGLSLKLDTALTHNPLIFGVGGVPHSYATGRPITLVGEAIKLEDCTIHTKDFRYDLGATHEHRRIGGYIVQILDGVTLPSFAVVVAMVGMARIALADPRTAIDHIISRDSAMRVYKSEIATLQGRIQLLSAIKE